MRIEIYKLEQPIKGCEFIGRLEEILSNNRDISNLQIDQENPALRRLRIQFFNNNFAELIINRAKYYSCLPYTIVSNNLPDMVDAVYDFIKDEMETTIGYIDVSQSLRKSIEQTMFALESGLFDMVETNDKLQDELQSHPIDNNKFSFYSILRFKIGGFLHKLLHPKRLFEYYFKK